MSAKKTTPIPAAKLALYDTQLASKPSIERKGATMPYTSTNGKMFTYLSPSGDLRLRRVIIATPRSHAAVRWRDSASPSPS